MFSVRFASILVPLFSVLMLTSVRGDDWPESFAIWGTVGNGTSGSSEWNKTKAPFLLAVTPEKILCAFHVDVDGKKGKDCFYANAHDPISFSFETSRKTGDSILQAGKLVGYVITQGDSRGDQDWRIFPQKMGYFHPGSLGLFLESRRIGVMRNDILRLLSTKLDGSSEHETQYGNLRLDASEGRLEQLSFSYDADSLVGPEFDGTWGDFWKSRSLPATDRLTVSTFEPPLGSDYGAFRIEAVSKQLEKSGSSVLEKRTYVINESSTDPHRIDELIQSQLVAIPEGESIVTDGIMGYVWAGGKVVRAVDGVAVANADELLFRGSSDSWIVYLLIGVASLGLLGFGAFKWRSKQ